MIFTDSEGREFEETQWSNHPEAKIIEPVEQQTKVDLIYSGNSNPLLFNATIQTHVHATLDQAQLIKAWIEAGMKYLNEPMKDFPNEVAETYNAARHSMRENN